MGSHRHVNTRSALQSLVSSASALLFVITFAARAAPAGSQDDVLLEESFEKYVDAAQLAARGWSRNGSLDLTLPKDTSVSHGGTGCVQFGREHSLTRKDASTLTARVAAAHRNAGFVTWTTWVLIGNTTPSRHSQVSSRLYLQALDDHNRIGPSVAFASARYNRDRMLLVADGPETARIPTQFPVDHWIRVTVTMNLDDGRWDFEVVPKDRRLLAARSNLHWRSPDFAGVGRIRIVCSYSNTNDGLRNAIDDIVVRTGKDRAPADTHAANHGSASITTEPRQYRRVNTAFYNSSFMSWAGDNLVDRMGLTDRRAAENRAKALADLGISGVLYNGRHFRLSYEEEWERINDYAKLVADVCHARGIKVIEHHEATVFAYSSYPLMLKKLDWLQRDVRTGEPHRWACPNNPDFIRFYANYLTNHQAATGVDGYMLDELGFASRFTCGCQHCRKTFRADLGRGMPPWVGTGGNFESNTYRDMLRWRAKITPRALAQLMAEIRHVRPEAMNMTYCSDYSDSRIASRGLDLTLDAALYASFVGWENMIAEALNGWRPFLRSLKLRLSYGNYYGIPVWSLNREMTTPEAVYFGWALCQLGKHSVWYGSRAVNTAAEQTALRRFNAWTHRMPHQHARCLTDTGLLLSAQTRFASASRNFFWHDFAGWTDMLLKGNRQFDTLLDGDLENPGRLGKYNALLLIGQACLTQEQCAHLMQWVADGGSLIWTGTTSLYDGAADRLRDFRLADETGIHFVGALAGPLQITGALHGAEIEFQAKHGFSQVTVADPKRSRVLAVARDGKGHEFPAVVETRFGRGRTLYIAADLGTQQVETEMRNRSTFRCREDAQLEATIRAAVAWAHARPPPADVATPPGIIATVYQQQGGQEPGTVYAHLLNASGKSIEPGHRAAYGRAESVPVPSIHDPVVLRIRAKTLGPAELRTPERDGVITVQGEQGDDGYTTFRIPGNALSTYLQMRIPAKLVIGQAPCPVPLAAGLEGK
jgi:hypothetical protein